MPEVKLGNVGDASVAATVFAVVDRAVSRRPEVARELEGATVRFELDPAYWPVRVRFGREEVEVADCDGAAADLTVHGTLPDLQHLLLAPMTAGVPRSRAALARLADGRVALEGPLATGRRLLRLLSLP